MEFGAVSPAPRRATQCPLSSALWVGFWERRGCVAKGGGSGAPSGHERQRWVPSRADMQPIVQTASLRTINAVAEFR